MTELNVLLDARQDPAALAETLQPEDIAFLIGLLNEKNNDIRYAAFLTLQKRSMAHNDIYPFWDTLAQKLDHENSYQRSIGVMLLAQNIRWDTENRLKTVLNKYMDRFRDEKFITARQAIQSLQSWLADRPEVIPEVVEELTAVPVDQLPPTQRKLILLDILQALLLIQDVSPNEEAAAFIFRALDGGLLAKKEKESILKRMGRES
jgi:HEAT repeat protein